MDELWIEAFRYNRWANLHLLDVCAKLSEDQLHLTAPGTYGTVDATFLHLLAAEQRYLRRLAELSQETFAERAGYSTAYIGMLERGERSPLPSTVEVLARALALSPEE